MYFEVSRRTPLRRILFIMVLPMMAAGVFSCAHIDKPVRVPVLRDVTIAPRPVRVWVGAGIVSQPLEIAAKQEVDVWSWDGSRVLKAIKLDKTRAGFSRGAVVIGDNNWGLPSVILVPREGDHIRVKGDEYPGCVELVVQGASVQAINYVPIEEYVAGVVSCEMPQYFDRAALRAQAIAARTYALWQMKENRQASFDVRNDQFSQVYRGLSGMTPSGRQAAQRTAGEVLVYDWRFLPALYFSTCGGYTLPASATAWAPQIPPLCGVPCTYCKASKKYRWGPEAVPSEEMEQALAKGNFLVGRLVDVKVTKTAPGGWVDTVEVTSDKAKRQISGQVLRQALGTSKLYSTKFSIRKSGAHYIFEGSGYGHGCGMCQWGADGMARAGFNYVEILRHYYPGADVLKIY